MVDVEDAACAGRYRVGPACGSRRHRQRCGRAVYVPDVLADTDGEFATLVEGGPARDRRRVCLLFEWVAGRSLRTRMTARRAASLGRLPARLQRDAAQWSPSDVSAALFDSLIVARSLHQLNLTLNVVGLSGLDSYVANHAERARAWMHHPTGL